MRKYQQLILLVTSIISVSLLLIYRHEYNRLRYVLEVFNFFGQPNDCSFPELLDVGVTNTLQHDWGPTPVWTTEEKFAIYSAFIKTETDVEALVVHDDNNVAIQSCFLWFESDVIPVPGKVNYSKISKLSDDNLSFFKYNCNVHTDLKGLNLYAVSFANDNKISKNIKKTIAAPLPWKKYELTTICVLPSEGYSKQQIVEFISFHKIIGVDSFIIYNNNIPYKFMHLLQKLSLKLGLEIIDFPWNYPYPSSSQIKSIILEDCLLRTKDRSKNVIVLDFKEFLVPKHHRTVAALLDSYDTSNRTNRFGLKILEFCADYNNKRKDREPTILHNVYYDDSKPPEYLYVHRINAVQSNSVINTQEISDSVAAIHRYVICTSQQSPSKMESVVLKYAKDLRKSTLFKLFKYDRL